MGKGRARKSKRRRANNQQPEHSDVERQSNLAAHHDSWPLVFQEVRDIQLDVENTPFVDIVPTETQLPADNDKVRTFMCEDDSFASYIAQAEKVADFCAGVNLESLQAREGEQDKSNAIVAWLDERSLDGHIRTRAKPLTAFELYIELSKPRFPSGTSVSTDDEANPSEVGQQSSETGCSTEACSPLNVYNADRRLLFITNLDRWSIYVLIRTASFHQATALRRALPRYLTSETFIQVTPMTKDRGGFELALHLSYYVWRTSGTEQKDDRQYTDGTALRQSQDVSFVHWKKNASEEFLYEGQVSCVIAGFDDWRWVAYCFSDTYFSIDADAEGEDILQDEEYGLENGGFRNDPLIGVAEDADLTTSNPRAYFLTVFSARLTKIRAESQLVVMKMEESIREYDQGRRLSESTMRKSNSEARENFQVLSQSFNQVISVMDLSTQLSERLCQTVDAVEKLMTEDEPRFNVFSGLPQCQPLLVSIKTELRELQRLKNALKKVEKRWKQLARMLELNLQIEATKIGYDNRGLSLVMILYVSPIAMAASIFSMDPKVIPFLPPNPKSFLGLLLGFVGVAVIHSLVTWRPNPVLALARNMRPGLQLRAPHLKSLGRRRTIMLDEENGLDSCDR